MNTVLLILFIGAMLVLTYYVLSYVIWAIAGLILLSYAIVNWLYRNIRDCCYSFGMLLAVILFCLTESKRRL